MSPDDCVISYVPLAHIYERMAQVIEVMGLKRSLDKMVCIGNRSQDLEYNS